MPDVPRNRYFLFLAIAAVGCGVDLATKAWLFSWPDLRGGYVHWLWPGHAGFQLSWNEGALGGMGQGRTWLFATLSIGAGLRDSAVALLLAGGTRSVAHRRAGFGDGRAVGQSLRPVGAPRLSLARTRSGGRPARACGSRLDSRSVERPVAVAEFQRRRFLAGRRCGGLGAPRHVGDRPGRWHSRGRERRSPSRVNPSWA